LVSVSVAGCRRDLADGERLAQLIPD
jgi:hypothetical protein